MHMRAHEVISASLIAMIDNLDAEFDTNGGYTYEVWSALAEECVMLADLSQMGMSLSSAVEGVLPN